VACVTGRSCSSRLPGPLRRREVTALTARGTILTGEAILIRHPRTLVIQRGSEAQTCPVAAVRAYLDAAHIVSGPLWRGFDKRDKALPQAPSYRTVSQILHDRARAAGVPGVSSRGRASVSDSLKQPRAAAKLPRFELQKRALWDTRSVSAQAGDLCDQLAPAATCCSNKLKERIPL
jgi:hypothetical protein